MSADAQPPCRHAKMLFLRAGDRIVLCEREKGHAPPHATYERERGGALKRDAGGLPIRKRTWQ